jgi:hypothetical protein
MAQVTNKSARMLHLGGTMCRPGVAVDVPDEMLEIQAVKDMIEAEELAVGADASKAEAAFQKKAAAEDAKQADAKKA